MMIQLWNFIIYCLELSLKCAAKFLKLEPLSSQLLERSLDPTKLEDMAKRRSLHNICTVFFCSSAGEFEQTVPLIERIQKNPMNGFVVVVFFSPSGIKFFKAKKHTFDYILSPLDRLENWENIFSSLRPTHTIVVRYELWPCFLWTAKKYSKLWLIDANAHYGGKLEFILKKPLLFLFDRIFTINSEATQFFESFVNKAQIFEVGDTKYDRALDRAKRGEPFFHKPTNKTIFVCGSVWEEDIELILLSLKHLKSHNPEFFHSLLTFLIPHLPEQASNIQKHCEERGLSCILFSKFSLAEIPNVVAGDQLGILAELYKQGDFAYVGGGLKRRVHNVLEPLCNFIPVAHGPMYSTSQEARDSVTAKISCVTANHHELVQWMMNNTKDPKIEDYMLKKSGATDLIFQMIG